MFLHEDQFHVISFFVNMHMYDLILEYLINVFIFTQCYWFLSNKVYEIYMRYEIYPSIVPVSCFNYFMLLGLFVFHFNAYFGKCCSKLILTYLFAIKVCLHILKRLRIVK